jgi:Ion channel
MLLPLMAGTALLLVSLISFGTATSFLVHVVVKLIQAGYTGRRAWKNVVVMTTVTLITAAAHLTQIALWAVAFLLCGQISVFEEAFYFSAQNYTSLGYGDIQLAEPWRLLGPLETINGLLLFGVSTAVLYAILSRLIANRLRTESDDRSEPGVNQDPFSGVGDSGSK